MSWEHATETAPPQAAPGMAARRRETTAHSSPLDPRFLALPGGLIYVALPPMIDHRLLDTPLPNRKGRTVVRVEGRAW